MSKVTSIMHALLAQGDTSTDTVPLGDLLLSCAPTLLVAVIFLVVIRRMTKGQRSLNNEYLRHRTFMREKTGEMVDLLRDISDKLDRGGDQP